MGVLDGPGFGPFQIGPAIPNAPGTERYEYEMRIQEARDKCYRQEIERQKNMQRYKNDIRINVDMFISDRNSYIKKYGNSTPTHEDYHLAGKDDLAYKEKHDGCKDCFYFFWNNVSEKISDAIQTFLDEILIARIIARIIFWIFMSAIFASALMIIVTIILTILEIFGICNTGMIISFKEAFSKKYF